MEADEELEFLPGEEDELLVRICTYSMCPGARWEGSGGTLS